MNQQFQIEVAATPLGLYRTAERTQTSIHCFAFDQHQLDLLACVLPDAFEIDGSALRHCYAARTHQQSRAALTVINLFMCTEFEPLDHLLDPDQTNIAVVTAGQIDPEYLHAAGYQDYLVYPFCESEVERRLTAAEAVSLTGSNTVSAPECREDRLLNEVCAFLASEPCFCSGTEALAGLFATNRTTLNALFKSHLGVGPITWHRQVRLDQAADLLVRTNLSVLQIALAVGYENPCNFSTAFKRHHGKGPREYVRKIARR